MLYSRLNCLYYMIVLLIFRHLAALAGDYGQLKVEPMDCLQNCSVRDRCHAIVEVWNGKVYHCQTRNLLLLDVVYIYIKE